MESPLSLPANPVDRVAALIVAAEALRARGDASGALLQLERIITGFETAAYAPASAYSLYADLLLQFGRIGEVLPFLQRAVERFAEEPKLWNRLGMVYQVVGQPTRALEASDRMLALQPRSAVAWANRALTLGTLQRWTDALSCIERAVDCDPANAPAWCHRGMLLGQLLRHEEALASFERAIALQPDLVAAWAQRSGPLRVWHRYGEALASCEKAIALDERNSGAWEQRAYALVGLGGYDEAGRSLDKALELEPANATARFSRGALRLTLGNFEAGWGDFEARAAARVAVQGSDAPVWTKGRSLTGLTILLRSEQGYGDTLQFCRFAPLLARQGARVLLSAPRPLIPLLASLGPGVIVVDEAAVLPPHDLQCPLMGVPFRLGTVEESIPADVPYLGAPADTREQWKLRLTAGGSKLTRRIGLAYSGNSGHADDHNRSLPVHSALRLIAAHPAMEWHLLQRDLRPQDESLILNSGVVDHRAALRDFCDTAALAMSMDAVVSVDTSISHLAGALAVPVHILLPARPEWRWLLDREDSPWYPSARLYRQTKPGQWDTALERLIIALNHLRS